VRAAAKAAHKQRGRRAHATKRKQAAASIEAPLQTTVDLTLPPAAATPARPSSPVTAAADAATAVVSADAGGPSQTSGVTRRQPPSVASSDSSASDGGGFDGFDSDLIEASARNGASSSS